MMNDVAGELVDLRREVARLSTLIETEGARCPYREIMARASNNVAKMQAIEERVRATELRVAGIAGVSGGGVAGVVIIVGKALGWM